MNLPKAKPGHHWEPTIFQQYKEIPDDWSFLPISEFGRTVGGGTPSTTDNECWGNGTIEWFTPEELRNLETNFVNNSKRKITKKGLTKTTIIPKNSLLVTTRASIGYSAINKKECTTNQGFQNVIVSNLHNVKFLMYAIRFNRKALRQYSQGTTFLEISKTNFRKIKILCPTDKREEEKIGSILSNIDELIQKQQQVIEQTKKLMKGQRHKLFTEGAVKSECQTVQSLPRYIKLKIPKHWNFFKISDVCDTTSGGTPLTSHPEYYDGEIPWLTTSELKDTFVTKTKYHITEDGENNSSAKKIPPNSTIVAMYGATIGKTCINTIEMTTNQACCIFTPKKENSVDPYFLQQILIYFRPLIVSLAEGGGQPNISQDFLKKFKIPFPQYLEQQKIASILLNTDLLIKQEKQYKEKLENLKRGLMQQLLTGEKRVIV